jgi:hypothetical protein
VQKELSEPIGIYVLLKQCSGRTFWQKTNNDPVCKLFRASDNRSLSEVDTIFSFQ